MKSEQNSFDQQIKEAYESQDLAYDPKSWDELKGKLDAMAPSPMRYFSAISVGAAAVGLVFLILTFTVGDGPSSLLDSSSVDGSGISEKGQREMSRQLSESLNKGDETASLEAVQSEEAATASAKDADAQQAEAFKDVDGLHGKSPEDERADAGNDLEIGEGKEAEGTKAAEKSSAETAKSTEQDGGELASKKKVEDPVAESSPIMIREGERILSASATHTKVVRGSCIGTTVHFEASRNHGDKAKYLWNFGDGFFSTEANPSHTFTKAGTFDVSLSVTPQGSGKISSNVVQAKIEVMEVPMAASHMEINGPESVFFENVSPDGAQGEWLLDGSSMGEKQRITVEIMSGTQQKLQLVASNESGCSDTLTHILHHRSIAEKVLLIDSPNIEGYQPNLEIEPDQFAIFDSRNGKGIFHSTDGETWDYSNASPGAYAVIAFAKNGGDLQVFKGTLKVK